MAMSPQRVGAQSIYRTLGILDCFADTDQDLSASEVARRTAVPLSTTHRLLQVLAETGYLEQDSGNARFRLGPATVEIGLLAYYRRGLQRVEGEVDALAQRTGVSADLAVRVEAHVIILVGSSLKEERVASLRAPLHSTALGKVLLAWSRDFTENDFDQVGTFTAHTERTITDPADLRDELHRVRALGYAVNDGESEPGIKTIAVPILDSSDRARFALALRSSSDVLTDHRLNWFVEHARICAKALQIHLISPSERGV
jgi:DNA-binding IclR family transcriptional regulator